MYESYKRDWGRLIVMKGSNLSSLWTKLMSSQKLMSILKVFWSGIWNILMVRLANTALLASAFKTRPGWSDLKWSAPKSRCQCTREVWLSVKTHEDPPSRLRRHNNRFFHFSGCMETAFTISLWIQSHERAAKADFRHNNTDTRVCLLWAQVNGKQGCFAYWAGKRNPITSRQTRRTVTTPSGARCERPHPSFIGIGF